MVVTVRSRRRGSVPGLHFKGVRPLLLPIEHHLGEHLSSQLIDLEVVLALITWGIYDGIEDLEKTTRSTSVLVGRLQTTQDDTEQLTEKDETIPGGIVANFRDKWILLKIDKISQKLFFLQLSFSKKI